MTDAPAWATSGLNEASRIVEWMQANDVGGEKRWTDEENTWHLVVTIDYVPVGGQAVPQLVPGQTEAEVNVVRGNPATEAWTFEYGNHEWRVKSVTSYG